jgi:hypothetical protein
MRRLRVAPWLLLALAGCGAREESQGPYEHVAWMYFPPDSHLRGLALVDSDEDFFEVERLLNAAGIACVGTDCDPELFDCGSWITDGLARVDEWDYEYARRVLGSSPSAWEWLVARRDEE